MRVPIASVTGQGMDVVVPVTVGPATDVSGADFTLTYDESVLTPTGVYRTTHIDGMFLVPNVTDPGTLRFGLFEDTSPFTGNEQVAWIVFRAIGAAASSSAVTFTQHELNEGLITSVAHNGVVNVVARDVEFAMPDTANGVQFATVSVPINVNPTGLLNTFSATVRFRLFCVAL